MARPRAVLFVVDGTLLDSTEAQAHAWLDALRGHGIGAPYDLVREAIGMGGPERLLQRVGVDPLSTQGRLIAERREAVFKALYVSDLMSLRGGRSLVERLKTWGLRRAVVAWTSAAAVADLLLEAAVADLFDAESTSDDTDDRTPHPNAVQVALDKLEVAPHEALMIGASPHDIAAAARAGVSTIALRSGGWRDADLEGAIAIYDHPHALLSRIEQSPLALGREAATPAVGAGRRRRGRASAAGGP